MRAALLAVVAVALPLLARGAPAGYEPVSIGSVCSRSQAVNVIPRLPRYTLLAQPVSADVGSYRLFDCAGANASRTCSVHTGFLAALSGVGSSPASVTAALGSAAVRGTVVDYAQASGLGAGRLRGGCAAGGGWWCADGRRQRSRHGLRQPVRRRGGRRRAVARVAVARVVRVPCAPLGHRAPPPPLGRHAPPCPRSPQ